MRVVITEATSDIIESNLWVWACQVRAQQADTVPISLPTTSPSFFLSLALFSWQLSAAETSNLLLCDGARPEQACGERVVRQGVVGSGGWGGGGGSVRLGPATALARPWLAALNLSPIKSPSLAGCNWARRAGSMWLLKMRRVGKRGGGGETGHGKKEKKESQKPRLGFVQSCLDVSWQMST